VDKILEAGALLIGGHSIEDDELKYGLSVTGTVHPKRLVTNAGARAGDKLILTKPLGTGIISTAIKGGMASKEAIATVTRSMVTLNMRSSELMLETGVSACTDITGFGFLGHACEMVQLGGLGMKINAASIPVFTGAVGFAQMGMIPGGTYRNKEFRTDMVDLSDQLPDYIPDILFDPQTSGGLLMAISASRADGLLARLHEAGIVEAAIVGEVVAEPKGRISVE
jgi:selenide,water dikinase